MTGDDGIDWGWVDRVAAGEVPEGPPPAADQRATPISRDGPPRGPDARFGGKIYSRSELKNIPAPEYVIDEILVRRAANLAIGATGTGKSLCVIDWAGCIATGRDWHGHPVITSGPVLIVIGEGASGLDGRVTAWENFHGRAEPIRDERLRIVVKPASLSRAETWRWIRAQAVEIRAVLIVLDTMSSLAPDLDETKDAALIIRRASDLAVLTGAAVVIVHHPGWGDPGRARGGSQLESNADQVLVFRAVDGSDDTARMVVKKSKDAEAGAEIWLRRTTNDDTLPAPILESSSVTDAAIPLRVRIVELLRDYAENGATGPELIAETDAAQRSTFYKAIGLLLADRKVYVVNRGRRGARYYLPEYRPEDAETGPGDT
jgi:hypothetical protein